MMKASALFRKALMATLPVMAGYLVLGAGFGIIAQKSGIGFEYAMLMSLLVYAGSMQYLAVGLLAAGTPYLTIAVATLMVNARHLFYGLSMLEPYQHIGITKPYLIFALTDETYSLVVSPPILSDEDRKRYFMLVSLLDHCYWLVGTLIGCLFAALIAFNTKGVDFALTAMFLTIFIDQWLDESDHFPALTGPGASLVCLLIFGSEHFLIPAMVVILVVLLIRQRSQNSEEAQHNE